MIKAMPLAALLTLALCTYVSPGNDDSTTERQQVTEEQVVTQAELDQPSGPKPGRDDAESTEHELFDETIGPVLAGNCTPCHFPDGKMYDRLPFDDPATVAEHHEKIRGRLDADQTKLLEQFVEGRPH